MRASMVTLSMRPAAGASARRTCLKGTLSRTSASVLCEKSNWMTAWVTEKLVKVGIPVDAILWNLAEGGEEVDILLEFLEEVWIFELKDRPFSAGDAYPFNYRRARYGATRAFIVTTEHVAPDAKRILEELAAQARRVAPVMPPSYVEGLDAVEPALEREVARTAVGYASRRLQPLAASTGFDLRSVVAAGSGTRSGPSAPSAFGRSFWMAVSLASIQKLARPFDGERRRWHSAWLHPRPTDPSGGSGITGRRALST